MYAPNPEKVKVVKEFARTEIVFAAARKPGTGRIFLRRLGLRGPCELDLDKDKPAPKELGRPR